MQTTASQGSSGRILNPLAPRNLEGIDAFQKRASASALPVLLVDLAPVRDMRNRDGSGRVINDVNHAIVTYPNSPLVCIAFELLAA